jgi:hypothetical protein
MKKSPFQLLRLLPLLVLTVLATGLLSSCQPEGCTDPMSDNYDPKAKKDDGSCVPWRDKFIATYSGDNACPGTGTADATIVISASATSDDGIVVSSLEAGVIFTARITGQQALTIPSQTILYKGEEVDISGTGTLKNETELEIEYTLKSGPISNACMMAGTQL